MTLFFNIENLEKESGVDSVRFITLLDSYCNNKLPSRNNKYKPAKLTLKGSSYLLNPNPLFKLVKNIDINYIVQYIKLAGRRDYSHYKFYDSRTLQLSYYPDINLNNIKLNPLLKITNTEIFFYYEEVIRK